MAVNNYQMKRVGMALLIAANLFCWVETVWFGSHWFAGSREEMLCDTVALLACLIGLAMVLYRPTTP